MSDPVVFLGQVVRWGESGLSDTATRLSEGTIAPRSRLAYDGHLRRFEAYRLYQPGEVAPAILAADWLASLHAGGQSLSTLRQAITALEHGARLTGKKVNFGPAQKVIAGAVRSPNKPAAGRKRKAVALRFAVLREAVAVLRATVGDESLSMPVRLRAAHDAALLVVGWLGAFRRGELVSLCLSDVEEVEDERRRPWLVVQVTRHKTTSQVVALPLPAARGWLRGQPGMVCPVACWRDYQALRSRVFGAELFAESAPAWLAYNNVGLLVNRRISGEKAITNALRRALRPVHDTPAMYSAHSLRAGLATELSSVGSSLADIANAGGWKKLDTVLDYARRARALADSPLLALNY